MTIFGFGFNGFGQLLPNCGGDVQSTSLPKELDRQIKDTQDVSIVTSWSTVCFCIGDNLQLQGFIEGKQNQQYTVKSPFEMQDALLTEETLTVVGRSKAQCATWKYVKSIRNVDFPKAITMTTDRVHEDWSLKNLASGELHTVAVTERQEAGEITDTEDSLIFRPFTPQILASQVCCGNEHVMILTLGGDVYTYGLGSRGQLGHGTTEKEPKPRVVEALQGVTMATVAAGGWHSAAISTIGDLYIWGWNESGQLGLPMKQLGFKPKRSQCSRNIARIDGSDVLQQECCETGTLHQDTKKKTKIQVAEYKELCPSHIISEASKTEAESEPDFKVDHDSAMSGSDGDEEKDGDVVVLCQMFPCLLEFPGEVSVSKVSCGSRHTAALSESGDLYTWGWNKYGQLGHGNSTTTDTITVVDFFRQNRFKVNNVTCGPWNTLVSAVDVNSTVQTL